MKKLLSSTLALLLMLTAVGCSSQTNGSTDTPQAASTSAVPVDDTTAAPEPYYLDTLPDVKYDGVTFTMVGESYDQRPNFGTGELNGDNVNDAIYKRQMALEERYKIKIESVAHSSRSKCTKDVNNMVLSNDDTYDLVFNAMATSGINAIASAGSLVELSSLPYLDFTRDHWAQTFIDNMTVDGKLFFAAGGTSPSYYLSAVACLFNADKAADYQLPDLYRLVEDGKWTVDKMGELLAQCNADLDGDNVYSPIKDFIGLVQTVEAGRGYFVAAGGKMIEKNNDGTFSLELGSDKNVALMDKLRSIFGNPENTLTIDAEATVDLGNTKSTKIGLFVQEHAMFATTAMMFAAQELREMNDSYGMLPLPKLDEVQERYITPANPYAPCATGIPRSATDVEMSALIMEAMAFLGEELIRPAVYDITLQGKLTRDEQSSKMLELIYNDIYFDFNFCFDFGKSTQLLRSYIVGDDAHDLIRNRGFMSSYTIIQKVANNEMSELIDALNAQEAAAQ